jgi:hypothetical protein
MLLNSSQKLSSDDNVSEIHLQFSAVQSQDEI